MNNHLNCAASAANRRQAETIREVILLLEQALEVCRRQLAKLESLDNEIPN